MVDVEKGKYSQKSLQRHSTFLKDKGLELVTFLLGKSSYEIYMS